MFGIPFIRPKQERDALAEETRAARGELASKIIELDRSKAHLEGLFQDMLAERNKDAR